MNQSLSPQLKTLSLILLISGLTFLHGFSQNEKRPHFIGINPNITTEPFYQPGELDINILPVVYQYVLTPRMDVRLTSILNYGIRITQSGISHYGVETAFPIYLQLKDNVSQRSKGFYAAPIINYTRNQIVGSRNIGVWVEPGFNLLFDNGFAVSVGAQYGRTYFNYDNAVNIWSPHFGAKIVLGKWL